MVIGIKKNVGIPKKGNSKYPFKEMKVGDSFTVPIRMLNGVKVAAVHYGQYHNKKFTTRIIGETVGVWREK